MAWITETEYLFSARCPKLFWSRVNEPEVFPAAEAGDAMGLRIGQASGEITAMARQWFPAGIAAPANLSAEEERAIYQEAKRKRTPLFGANFAFYGCRAQPDVLRPAGLDSWDVIAIRDTTYAHRTHLEALAFQTWILHGAEVKARRIWVMHLNGHYVRQGALDPRRLFVFQEVTRQVAALSRAVEGKVDELFAWKRRPEPPETSLGAYCETPGDCPLKPRCWSCLPADHIFHLYKLRRAQAFQLARAGITSLNLLPEKLRTTKFRQIQLTTVTTRRPHLDRPAIRRFLSQLEYPLYCLDFETFATALPPFEGLRPYEMVPFQFSLHVARVEPAAPEHYSFLSEGRADPRPQILELLRRWLGNRGTILAYNAKFELAVLRYLGRACPEYSSWLAHVEPRMVDLLAPFKSFAYYHPDQKGSASLKAVLPALTGRGYADLAIREGNTASAEYVRVTFGDVATAERQQVREWLEQYCGRDTEGMLWIIAALNRLASAESLA